MYIMSMEVVMTTHRTIQISQLFDTASLKAAAALRGVSNLQRIGNSKGAEFHLAKAEQWERIAFKCRARLDKDAARRETIRKSQAWWSRLAIDEDALADHYEKNGMYGDVSGFRFRADSYRRVVKAFDIELETGVAVCSCCFKPFGQGISFLESA
jgi:hypothetical protein